MIVTDSEKLFMLIAWDSSVVSGILLFMAIALYRIVAAIEKLSPKTTVAEKKGVTA